MLRPILRTFLVISFLASLSAGQGGNWKPPFARLGSPLAATPAGSPGGAPTQDADVGYKALAEAARHYASGEYTAAIQSYGVVLENLPKSPDGYAGLTRAYLKNKNVEQAYLTATKGVEVTNSATVRAALGEVYFRQGKIPEAEREWVGVLNSGYPSARAYWGLSRVRTAMSLHAQARQLLDKAYELDPDDPDIRRSWLATLTIAEQIVYWEKLAVSPTLENGFGSRRDIDGYVMGLIDRQKQSQHACHVASPVASTQMKLVRMMADGTHLRGYGITVSLNGKKGNLLLDTGLSGIMVNEDMAVKAGVTKVTQTVVAGSGDKGLKAAYYGLANSIKIGDLEFEDCNVEVLESHSVGGDVGLIGSNMFSPYLVDIDFPSEKLNLQPLPAAPVDSSKASQTPEAEAASRAGMSGEKSAPLSKPALHDRYIAPEMQSYSQVYRFQHILMIPTSIGGSAPLLFVLDSGSTGNFMSLQAAREYSKVQADPNTKVQGLNGGVARVYLADKTVLRFGHLQQVNDDITSIDLSPFSDGAGVEVSGILGFGTLRQLDLRIDYRDGLVDFRYAQRH